MGAKRNSSSPMTVSTQRAEGAASIALVPIVGGKADLPDLLGREGEPMVKRSLKGKLRHRRSTATRRLRPHHRPRSGSGPLLLLLFNTTDTISICPIAQVLN